MQSPTFSIEPFLPGSGEHKTMFAALNRQWLEKYFRVEDVDNQMFADPQGVIIGPGGTILFARLNGEIVGTGGLLPCDDGSYELIKMAVEEKYQGQGIGRALAEQLIAEARKKKVTMLYIVSNKTLEQAIALYRSLGFRDSAVSKDSHYERGNITLELALNPATGKPVQAPEDPTRYGDWVKAGRCIDF